MEVSTRTGLNSLEFASAWHVKYEMACFVDGDELSESKLQASTGSIHQYFGASSGHEQVVKPREMYE